MMCVDAGVAGQRDHDERHADVNSPLERTEVWVVQGGHGVGY